MTWRISSILFIIWALMSACTSQAPSTPMIIIAPTAAPIPTATPETLSILDWQLAFSTASQKGIVRCEGLVSASDDAMQEIFSPLIVEVSSTLLTPQVLKTALNTLETSNPSLVKSSASFDDLSEVVYVVLQVSPLADQDIYALSQRISGRRYALSQISFSILSAHLTAGDQHLKLADDYQPIDHRFNQFYVIPFEVAEGSLNDLISLGSLHLSLELAANPPIQNRFCADTTRYDLHLPLASGSIQAMYDGYGNNPNNPAVDTLRFSLLTQLLPEIMRNTPEETETVEPIMTQTVQPSATASK